MNYKLYTPALLLSISAIFISCEDKIDPSSTITTQETVIGGYTGLDISDAFDVEVSYSDDESVEIQTNENLHDFIEVFNEDGVLHIGVDNGLNISGSSTFKARVYTKNPVKFIKASGASYINIDDALFDDEVTLYLSGASFVKAGMEVNTINATIKGASNFHLVGLVSELNATLSGASRMTDGKLEVDMASLDLSGASTSELTINKELRLGATGASVLRYSGDAIIKEISLSGASTIEKI